MASMLRAGMKFSADAIIFLPMTSDHEQKTTSPRRVGFSMIVLAWIVGLGIATAYFSGWLEHQQNPNQRVETVIRSGGEREVVLRQNRYGHYVANGTINGEAVTFLLDTGATDISVPSRVAERAGLKGGTPARARTAAGVITTYTTVIDSVELGGIQLRKVRAGINPHMRGDEVLLGMSFLRQLEFSQQGDRLTLRQSAGNR